MRRELQLPAPHVIKIDVEGFEPSALAGLAETMAGHRPILCFEHIFLSDEQIREMMPKDYLLYFIQDDGSISSDFSARRHGHDALAVPPEKAGRIKL
jgi:hypothetical protein